jgi:hypothetical protein
MDPDNTGPHRRCLGWMGTRGEDGQSQPQSARYPEESVHQLPAAARSAWKPSIGFPPPTPRTPGETLRGCGGGESGAGIPRWWPRRAPFLEVLPPRAASHPRARCVPREFPPRLPCGAAARLRRGKTRAGCAPRPSHRKTLGAAPTQRVSRKPPLQASCGKAGAPHPHNCHASPEQGRRPRRKANGGAPRAGGVGAEAANPRPPDLGGLRHRSRSSTLGGVDGGRCQPLDTERDLRAQEQGRLLPRSLRSGEGPPRAPRRARPPRPSWPPARAPLPL